MSSSTPKTSGGGAKRLQSAKGATLLATAELSSSSSSSSSTSTTASSSLAGLLEAFPVWVEQQGAADKEDKNAGKYEDLLGLSLPTAAWPFCDAWKRAEELLQGLPAVPMVCLRPPAPSEAPTAADGKKGKEAVASRELDGKLYAGHETFEWLLAVISYVMAAEKSLRKGEYLWELISPKEKDGLPARSTTGRYRVKLFLLDTWRMVTVDDRVPLDLFGRPLLVGSRPLQLWPLLLCKAILKVMAVYRSLDITLPHQVAAFQMLTGWPQEDLLDALGGTPAAGGALFDRLEDVLPGPTRQISGLPAIASCCLVRRSKPQRAPPRLVVLSAASGVGRSQLVARLLAEFPDKFGVTVRHTSRLPREHEVDGRDYHFTTKQQLLRDIRGKKFLEAARVTVHSHPCNSSAAAAALAPPQPLSFWYGTSLATVREVAATGKLCVMSLDVQGAEALRSNPRIDGLYLYISTSSADVLSQRQKQRLSEADSTLAKRLAWAKQQVAKSSAPGLFDDIIANTSLAEAYAALKEAISKLSPIIRNRLRGLPAYVLDYSDLIPPNSVEKPFLKPVILAGTHTGERRLLLEMLVQEFPDVFDLPRQHTTRPPDLHSRHVGADGDELALVTEPGPGSSSSSSSGGGGGSSAAAAAAGITRASGPAAVGAKDSISRADSSSSSSSSDASDRAAVLGPPPCVLSKEEFEAAVASGQLLEHHADLFTNPLAVHRHGHSLEDLQAVIKAGKLPLLELEAEQTELLKVTKSVDCLSVFLAPSSLEEHQQRLQQAATESDEEVAGRGAVAAAELAAVRSKGVFDQVLVNDDLEEGYRQLKAAISRFRPDLIPPAADEDAARAAQQAAANTPVPLLVAGPAGAGREQLVQQLLQRFPQRFAQPRQVTDRKPAKGEKEVSGDVDFVKPEALTKLVTQGQVVWSWQDAPTGGASTTAVTAEAVNSILAAGKLALLDVGAATVEQLQPLKQHPSLQQAFTVYVSRQAALEASLETSPEAMEQQLASLETALQAVTAAEGLVQALVTNDEAEEAFTQLQVLLSAALPWAMPPLLQPLVVAGPFGSGKRAVLQRLVAMLPDVLAVPKVVTSKPPTQGRDGGGMEVVTLEAAQQMCDSGQFLVHQEVLGHHYGITGAAVRKQQALGKLPLLDLDRVQDVEQLRASGFLASYLYLQPHSLEALQARIKAEILATPSLLYEPEEAAAKAAAEVVKEAEAAAAKPELFEAVVPLDPQDLQTAVGKLGLELHQRYPSAVPSSFVWGVGRPLWDPAVRVLGLKPLRVVVLGPAASGKSMQCAMLAQRFSVPHINVGDLLYAEVAAKTPLGLEAQRHMDSSKTVPDKLLMRLLLERLEHADCRAQGWVLDGFPHTRKQAEELTAAGQVPDKVLLLEGPHNLLLNMVKFRRIDYSTGKVYHLAEPGALSEAVLPLRPDGSVDADVMARLSVRHDDSMQNVANRLALWDRQVQGLRAAYEDVTLRLPAAGHPATIFALAESFVRLEADLPSGPDAVGPGSVWPLVESWQLEELTYRVVSTVRFKRQQLLQLQQLDGKLFWCNLKEVAGNSSCMLLAHNPGVLPVVKAAKRLDTTIQHQQLLLVDSPEPFRLLTCISMGPQHLALPPLRTPKQVFVLVGPTGAGRSSLAHLLLRDFPEKLLAVPLLTNRAPQLLDEARAPELGKQEHKARGSSAAVAVAAAGSTAAQPAAVSAQGPWPGTDQLQFVSEQQFSLLQQSQQLAGVHQHMDASYAVPAAAFGVAAQQGRAALVVGSVHLAAQLRCELPDVQVVCVYLDADTGALDQRIRQLAELDEQQVQALLADADQQKGTLQGLQEQQEQLLRDLQQLQRQGGPSAPQTPGPAAALAAKGAPTGGKLTLQVPAVAGPGTAPQTTRGSQQRQSWGPQCCVADVSRDNWLFCVANPDKQQQACYMHVKGVLSRLWPAQQQFQPGLMLLQHHPAAAALSPTAWAERPATALTSKPAVGGSVASGGTGHGAASAAAAAAAAAAASVPAVVPEAIVDDAAAAELGLDGDAFHSSSTELRLRALTAASAQLVLPRGRHLLQLQCCPSQLHCVTFHASSDFTLDSADKLLPAACKMHVLRESNDTQHLPAGSRQLLFRYLLKPAEPCSVSVQYQATNTALQASTQLLLQEVSKGTLVQALRQPSVLLPPSAGGYLLLALCEPLVDVPAGSWSLCLTSDRKLPPLTELPCSRRVAFSGVYAPNTKAVLSRFVISPTSPVNVAVLARLRLTAAASANASAADVDASGPTGTGFDSSSGSGSPPVAETASSKCALSFAVQVFDTAGARDVAWHADYKLLTSVQSGGGGCVSIPNLHLAAGKYLLVLQLLQAGSRQWVDPDSGSTSPLPEWQLQLIPGADDKTCPITQDDSWDRHFEATLDAWQQQAVAAATAAATGAAAAASTAAARPGSSNASRAALAAAKERAKTAQAALERHLAAAAATAAQGGSLSTAASGAVPATLPSATKGSTGAAAGIAPSSSSSTSTSSSGSSGPQAPAAGDTASTAATGKPAAGAAAAKGKPGAAAHAAANPAVSTPPAPPGAAGHTPDADGGISQRHEQMWPGALPAAAAPVKQPTEAVIRQVKGTAADVLQLSPADQLRLVGHAGSGPAATVGDGCPAAAGAVLTPAAISARLQQLQAAAASKAGVVASTAHSMGQLQAAAAQLAEQQASSFLSWREQCLAARQEAVQRKTEVLQAICPPPSPAPAAAPAPAATAHKGGSNDKIPAGKGSR